MEDGAVICLVPDLVIVGGSGKGSNSTGSLLLDPEAVELFILGEGRSGEKWVRCPYKGI